MPARVSVIIPAHNSEKTIEKTIESVFKQTFSDWELVIVDDGSKNPDFPAIANHPKVKVIRQKHQGLSCARNAGINNSTGEYIAFLDADDYWKPGKLAAQLMVLDKAPSAGLCYTNFEIVDSNAKVLSNNGFVGGAENYTELLSSCCIGVSSVMLRRRCLENLRFDENYTHAQDFDLWLSIAKRWKLKYVPTREMQYRIHHGQMSAQYMTVFHQVTRILSKHLQAAKETGDKINEEACYVGLLAAKQTYACQAFDSCRVAWNQGRPLMFASHMWNTLIISKSPAFIAAQAGAHITARWTAFMKAANAKSIGD